MRKKLILLSAALLACAMLFASCAKEARYLMDLSEPAYEVEEADYGVAKDSLRQKIGIAPDGIAGEAEPAEEAETKAPEAPKPSAAAGRKLVKNISAEIETLDFDAYLQAVEARAAALGGYTHSKQTGDYGYYGQTMTRCRNASLVLRIPAQALDEFKGSLGNLGKVTRIDESVRDETMSYNDTAAHIEALTAERDALLGLMANAKKLEELLMLQERVTDVRRQLNSLEGQIRLLDDQVSLSTVTLTVTEVAKLTPESKPAPKSWFARTWTGFWNNLRGVVRWLGELLSGLIIALPWLVVVGVPAAAVIFVIVRRRKKKNAKE
jgi:hypothetical protein